MSPTPGACVIGRPASEIGQAQPAAVGDREVASGQGRCGTSIVQRGMRSAVGDAVSRAGPRQVAALVVQLQQVGEPEGAEVGQRGRAMAGPTELGVQERNVEGRMVCCRQATSEGRQDAAGQFVEGGRVAQLLGGDAVDLRCDVPVAWSDEGVQGGFAVDEDRDLDYAIPPGIEPGRLYIDDREGQPADRHPPVAVDREVAHDSNRTTLTRRDGRAATLTSRKS